MNPLDLLSKVGSVLLAHPELVKDIVDLIEGGADPEEIKRTIRDMKKTVSDQAMKEELGL